jgi:hypothetical protein
VQLQEQNKSVDGANLTLAWLVWLLPGVATAIVVLYVLSATFGLDFWAVPGLVTSGRGGEILAYIVGLSVWGFGRTTQLISQNAVVVLIVAAVGTIVWVIRQF